MKDAPKIIWKYHYVHGCKEVTPDDEIDSTPDKHDRWQIRGYIKVKTRNFKEYQLSKHIFVSVAFINREITNHKESFTCRACGIYDANLGLSEMFLSADSAGELMKKVQDLFDRTHKFFINLK